MTTKDKIRKLCKERGTSANKLEKEIGLSQGYISKLSRTIPSSSKLQKIADYLEVTPDELLGDDVYSKYSEPVTNDFSEDVEQCINNVIDRLRGDSGNAKIMYLKGTKLTDTQIELLADDLKSALNRVIKLSERRKSEE